MVQYDQFFDYGQASHSAEFQRCEPNLKLVAHVCAFLATTLFNERLRTTSVFRKKTTDSGIHEAYRAIDFAPLKKIENTYLLLRMINKLFVYDSRVIDTPEIFKMEELHRRQGLQVANENPWHGTNLHIHLQARPETTWMTKHLTIDLLTMAGKDSANFKPLDLKA